MDVHRFRAARPLLTVATILAVTVTSCSSASTTPASAGAVSSTPVATSTATKVTALGQGDAGTLSLAAKQYLNREVDTPGKTTWSVTFSRAASSESGQLRFGEFVSPDGSTGGFTASDIEPQDYKFQLQEFKSILQEYNQRAASACGTASSSVLAAGHSTRTTFLTAELGGEHSIDTYLEIQEWDAVAPSAAVQALSQMATTCGSRLADRSPFAAQSVQVLGSPALATQTSQGNKAWNSLVAFSGTRMIAVSSQGWNDGAPDKPPLTNDVLTQLASALLGPSVG